MKSPSNDIKTCSRQDCGKIATHAVVLEARNNPHHEPARAVMVYVCAEHSAVQWDDLIDEKGWKTIVEGFTANGLAAPSKRYSHLVVVDIRSQSHSYSLKDEPT